ncbi:MAG: tetratricopeptide repeat protein [Betaproteobacteria bacterium]|nr:tetratricopeptide repeat protein [Betaproteobacteria bacterium]
MVEKSKVSLIDQPLASRLAREGFELWEAGKLEESCVCYVKALDVADPNHWALSAYHGEFACVLAALGKTEEATSHLEKAIATELAQGQTDTSPIDSATKY